MCRYRFPCPVQHRGHNIREVIPHRNARGRRVSEDSIAFVFTV